MGDELTKTEELADAERRAAEEAEKIRKLMETPISEDDAKKAIAEISVQLAQLSALRLRKAMEVNMIDQQIATAEFEKSVIYRRCINPQGTGTGGAEAASVGRADNADA